jgi:hypothetical protein
MLVWKFYFLFQDTPCVCGRPRTTNTGRLLAVCPNETELLAVIALRKTIRNFIGLYIDYDVAKAWQSENFLGFCRPSQGYKMFMVAYPSEGDRRVAVICLMLITSKPRLTGSPIRQTTSAGVLRRRWRTKAFMVFLRLGVKSEICKVIVFWVGFYCLKICHGFCGCCGPVSGVMELKIIFYHAFQLQKLRMLALFGAAYLFCHELLPRVTLPRYRRCRYPFLLL